MKGFFEPRFGGWGKLDVLFGLRLRCRTPQSLPQGQQLPPVLRASLTYLIMEMQLNSGQERERTVHGFGRKPCVEPLSGVRTPLADVFNILLLPGRSCRQA
ncbi:MAG: hypothetical protein NBKEAIPA_01255 [Nitrospirae bacterium]|nr:MAG: hypothetical protein UZ03_NOB001001629 [Nitrospira sp. OLB3]MBV6469364.1 hypothetical protein [Nitrospirota bacterium]